MVQVWSRERIPAPCLNLNLPSILPRFIPCSTSNLEPRFGNHRLQILGHSISPPNFRLERTLLCYGIAPSQTTPSYQICGRSGLVYKGASHAELLLERNYVGQGGKSINFLCPKMACMGPVHFAPESPRQGLCGSVLRSGNEAHKLFSGAPEMGVLGGVPRSLCASVLD